jgi:hypothetical protein
MTQTIRIQANNKRSSRKNRCFLMLNETAPTRTATTAPRSHHYAINCSTDFLPKQRIVIR